MNAVSWRPREPPLAPEAVAAWGEAATALRRRLLAAPDGALGAWRGVAGEALIVVVGDELPWVDGAVYLARDRAAPALYVPAPLEPDVPVELLERALRRRHPSAVPPLALVPCGGAWRAVSLGVARPIDRAFLERLP